MVLRECITKEVILFLRVTVLAFLVTTTLFNVSGNANLSGITTGTFVGDGSGLTGGRFGLVLLLN